MKNKMIKLLAKLFINNPEDYTNPEVREKYGVLCGGFGIFLNLIMFSLKFVFGTISGSIAMVADAFNNLSDAGSSIVSIFGFKLAGRKPDPEHPFGFGRIEYVSGLIITFLIFLMGFELMSSSIEAVKNPSPVEGGLIPFIVMGAAILIKFYMFVYNNGVAKKISSVSMAATAKDSLSDMISTAVVIISAIVAPYTSLPVDGIAGIVVALFIFFAGWESAKETVSPLLGQPPEKELVDEIRAIVLSHEPILDIHDLVVHDYGPGRLMISLHAEVPGDRNVYDLHDVMDVTEVDLKKKLNCHATIHMDPVDTQNPRLAELKQALSEIVPSVAEGLSFHDVRMVPGVTHTNLIFDVVRPHDCSLTKVKIAEEIRGQITVHFSDILCVINIDDSYI